MLILVVSLPARADDPDGNEPRTHRIRKGEALYLIGKKYGCSADELYEANRGMLPSKTKIFPGQVITIPDDCTGRKSTKKKKVRKKARPEQRGSCYDCRWRKKDIDSRKLKREMKKLGFDPPRHFRALVVKTTLTRDRQGILRHQLFDYGGDSTDHGGWNPASTIKLFSGVAALERVNELGFSPKAKVTFHYDSCGDKTFGLDDLYEKAVHLSKNIAHNRLVQLAGFDHLNGPGGTLDRAGLDHSYVMKAYELSNWEAEGHSKYLRKSPRITLREGKRKKSLSAATSRRRYPCHSSACTSLSDLARMMCTLMLHEQLPRGKRLHLGRGDHQGKHLLFIRRKLNRKRNGKKDPVWDVLEKHFIPRDERENPKRGGYQLFRKAGFSQDWLSENMYIYLPHGRTRWIVTMAAYGGRDVLTEAADVIARLIKEDRL